MKVTSCQQVDQKPVEMEGATGCCVRWLIGREDNAPNFAMREFEVAPGGHTPRHHHPYEHEVYVVAGQGTVIEGETQHAIRAGDVIFVKPDEVHQFKNNGDQTLKFLCLIPNTAYELPVTAAPECG
ncbi:MAG: cupin domain-containing protein [Pirellulaceae bacterium]